MTDFIRGRAFFRRSWRETAAEKLGTIQATAEDIARRTALLAAGTLHADAARSLPDLIAAMPRLWAEYEAAAAKAAKEGA